jgi:hypothetical protein
MGDKRSDERAEHMAAGDYPEDWREQGWCCRECAVMAWYSMSPELRRELLASMTATEGGRGL